MMYYDGHIWGMPFLSGGWVIWISIIGFWLLISTLFYFIAKAISSGNRSPDGKGLEILKERYAKGEITKEEYERVKRDIS